MRRLLLALMMTFAAPAIAEAGTIWPIDSTNLTWDSGHGTQVEYLSAGGEAYLWYPGNKVILPGQWKAQGANLCFKYGPNTYNPVTHVYGDKWECEPKQLYTAHLFEQAKGDVFKLAGRTAAPFSLPRNIVTLEMLGQRIGLGVGVGEVHYAPLPPGPKLPTVAEAQATCAAIIAKANTSKAAMVEAALTYYHGIYLGKPCVPVDYLKAFALLKQAGDTASQTALLADLKTRAATGNPKAISALEKLGKGG